MESKRTPASDWRCARLAHAKKTGRKAASNAGKTLANSKSPKAARSAAASALSQRHGSGRGRKGK